MTRSAVDLRRKPGRAIAAVILAGAAVAGAEEVAAPEARGKILATMELAVGSSPEGRMRQALLRSEVAELQSSTGAGAPSLAWQREGIGPGFDRRPNSIDYLRLSWPLNPVWGRDALRELRRASNRLLEAGERVSDLELAILAARRWLDLAVETELVALAETRARRLESALAIQTRRYELGEISGSERAQLDLALARERALLHEAELRRIGAEEGVAAFVGGDPPLPVVGDLDRLVGDTPAPEYRPNAIEAARAGSPHLRLGTVRDEVAGAQARRERQLAWGRPELGLEWERIPELGQMAGIDAAGFSLSVPLPLGIQARRRIAAAEHRAEAMQAGRDRLELELQAGLDAAARTASTAEAALRSLEATQEGLPLTEHSLAEQFRLGAITYVVYLDGQFRSDEVRRSVVEAQHRLLIARLELARLLGSDEFFPLPGPEGGDSQ